MATSGQTDAPTVRGDRRALLVTAATELFTERAYDEVTTSEVARRAGVAYGLIAHHFTNKRGLYHAVINAVADDMRDLHETPPTGGTPAAQLREVLNRHIAYLEDHARGFVALIRGGSDSDPQVRALIEEFRWRNVARLLHAFGVAEPIRPVLRTAMRGWVGYLNEMVMDHLDHRDLTRDDLVELTVANLVVTLRTAHAIDPDIGVTPAMIDLLAGTRGAGAAT